MMSNHYENIYLFLKNMLKADVMSNVYVTTSFNYYKLVKVPQIVLRGFDKLPNDVYGLEEKTEINGINVVGDTTVDSPIITNIESVTRLSVDDVVSGAGIPVGSKIVSLAIGSQITIDNNATITNTEVPLAIVFDKVEVYRNSKKNDMEFELIMATDRKLGMLDYTEKLDQFFLKYGTITVDDQEYDIDIISPFTNTTIPNYSDLKAISGRFQVKEVIILGDIFEKIARVKTVDVSMENK